ncbi:MAG TPA: Calx-beta domain-containing protein [Dokdonella sp.]
MPHALAGFIMALAAASAGVASAVAGDASTPRGGLVPGAPVRTWSFREVRGDALEEVELASDTQTGGDLLEIYEFGGAWFDEGYMIEPGAVIDPDGIAVGLIGGINDGATYWVAAEAPIGDAQVDNDPIGSTSRLVQYQTFTKDADNATYRFTLTKAFAEAWDGNGLLGRPCPDAHRYYSVMCDLTRTEVHLDVKAYTLEPGAPMVTFYRTAGGAMVDGSAIGYGWVADAWSESAARVPLWNLGNFDVTRDAFNGPNGHARIDLHAPRPYDVDLSTVQTGHRFTVRVAARASTYNRSAVSVGGIGSEAGSAASAYLRDPATFGGTEVTTAGLTAIDTPLPIVEPDDSPVTPAPCVPGPAPDPAAGLLQFSQAEFTIAEADATPVVAITRTGGSTGAVTATVTSSDGTAIAGTDYTAVHTSVFFADGDAAPRLLVVPITQDALGGEAPATVNLALSAPGGCAGLGPRAAAVLTIRDDDPAQPSPSMLDASFDGDGKATIEAFGGDRSAMALQPDGKIVMVGGTFADFTLARFNFDGSPDEGFGDHGKVVTDMVPGVQEQALAVAIQLDNKIVVAGYTRPDFELVFALARYNSDGSLDDGFGAGGRVVGGVEGIAYAVAIQPDGRIVAGGRVETGSSFDGDVQLARFAQDGSPDGSFGVGGSIAVPTDIVGDKDAAANIVLLPGGGIVVSGGSIVGGATDPTGLARYLADGSLDAAFGSGGKVILDQRVGEGMALQGDGKLVLVGSVETATPPATTTRFAVMRLEADGDVDATFGEQGLVTTALSERSDIALAVALQGDGGIVVAGASSRQVNPDFAATRYFADGTLDEAFGTDGVLEVDFFGFEDAAESVAIQYDGRIVLGGLARDDVDGFGAARLWPGRDRLFDDGFER